MARYLDLLRASRARSEPQPEADGQDHSVSLRQDDARSAVVPPRDAGAKRLEAAGWKHKRRGGLTIWERPDTGFWFAQDMALHLLGTKNMGDKSGAKARR